MFARSFARPFSSQGYKRRTFNTLYIFHTFPPRVPPLVPPRLDVQHLSSESLLCFALKEETFTQRFYHLPVACCVRRPRVSLILHPQCVRVGGKRLQLIY